MAPLKVLTFSRAPVGCTCFAERAAGAPCPLIQHVARSARHGERRAERAAGAPWTWIQHVAYSARRGERHTLRHQSERHAVGLDRDMVFRFQALFRAYRSISTIADWKPIALHLPRP